VTLVVGFDTATAATAAAVWAPGGDGVEVRDDPAPGARPAHAAKLLALVEEALERAGAGWEDVTRLAVGVGPGGFTGLRHGIATARALAQARGLPVAGVSSLEALAAGAGAAAGRAGGHPIYAVIDARRGEVFAAAWAGAECLLEPVAIAPADLAARLASGPLATHLTDSPSSGTGAPLAAGDGAIRFRDELERAGAHVPADDSPVHRVSAIQVCRLGAAGAPAARDALLPDYRREPDAKPPQLP
jgi:tRNA threonylcarbamoyladenosine biosynthesis protein TsaB